MLDILRDEGLIDNARRVGEGMKIAIRTLAAESPHLGDVRGAGLFIGVDVVRSKEGYEPAPRTALQIVNRMREDGILISASGPNANVLKIRPPLVFSESNADRFLSGLRQAVHSGRGVRCTRPPGRSCP